MALHESGDNLHDGPGSDPFEADPDGREAVGEAEAAGEAEVAQEAEVVEAAEVAQEVEGAQEAEGAQDNEIDEQELTLVMEILKALTKTVKAFTIYPPDNPIYHKFGAELNEKFNSFFEIQDNLTLKVEQFSLSYKGVEVFKSDDRDESIALFLYVDGIREICFHDGLTLEEVGEFIDVLRLNPKEQNLDDDIVTLLWEKDIKHISHFAPEEIGEEEIANQERIRSYAKIIPKPTPLAFHVEPPTGEELEALKDEFAGFGGDKLLSEAFELFAELVFYRPDIRSYEYFMDKIRLLINIFIDKDEINKVTGILKRLKQIRETAPLPDYQAFIDKVIEYAGSRDKLRKVLSGDISTKEMNSYLLLLNPASIPELMAVLGDHESMRTRKLLCDVIAAMGTEHIDAISGGLEDPRWYLARNTVMILGRINNPSVIKHLQKVVGHPDTRVRREIIWALGSMNHEAAKELLKHLLNDDDSNIRTYALKALMKFGGTDILDAVKQSMAEDDFKDKPFEEKQALLGALGKIGGEDSFPALAGYFEKKGLLRRQHSAEMRACAAYGLGLVGTDEAFFVLEGEMNSKDGIVRQACEKALKLRSRDA